MADKNLPLVMKKTYLLILCVVILMVTILSGCGSKKPAKATEPATTPVASNDANTYFLVGEQAYDPISFEENGEAVGISPDVIREAFKRMGYKVKIQLLPWKRAQEIVKDGEADGLFSAYKTPQREEVYTFPQEPLLIEKNVFVVRKDSTITYDGDIAKMSKYGIGTLTGYATLEKYLEKRILTNVDNSTTTEEALNKLISGDRGVDLVVNTNYILAYTAKKMGKSDVIKELSIPVSENPSYLAFTKKKDLSAVMAKFEVELKKMKADGSFNAIVEKYIGKQK